MPNFRSEHLSRSLQKLLRLKDRRSTKWIQIGVSSPESFAEHCWTTANLALIFGSYYGPNVDYNRCVQMALIQDVARIEVPDFPRRKLDGSISYAHQEEDYQALEWNAVATLFRPSPLMALRELWDEYTANETLEATIVHDLKKIAFVLEAQRNKKSPGVIETSLRMVSLYEAEDLNLPKSREIFKYIFEL